jgi:tripartite ATP-independent transporter DctP family solute receptor
MTLKAVIVSGLLAVVATWSGSVSAAEFTLRINHTLPAAHLRQKHAELFKGLVEKVTAGKVEVQIFPAGQLYKRDADAIKAVRSGAIEGAMVTTGDLALFAPAFNIYETPFRIGSYDQLHALIDSPVGAEILSKLEPLGVKGLVHTDAGSAIIVNRLRPITSAQDISGMRLRASAGRLQVKAFGLLGVSAIQLAFGDIAPSLERGIIDGVLSTPSAFASSKLGSITKYGTWTRQQFFPPVIIVSLAWWNKLPPDVRTAINGTLSGFEEQAREMNIQEEKKAIEVLKGQGMTIIDLDQGGRASFLKKLEPVYAEARQGIGPDIYDRAIKVIEGVH